jgi:hypothetical protein
MYKIWDFWFENILSGNPGYRGFYKVDTLAVDIFFDEKSGVRVDEFRFLLGPILRNWFGRNLLIRPNWVKFNFVIYALLYFRYFRILNTLNILINLLNTQINLSKVKE